MRLGECSERLLEEKVESLTYPRGPVCHFYLNS
jgi:hypothetical protein